MPTMDIDYHAWLRDDILKQRRALEDFDIEAGTALMCEQYRDAYRQKYEAQLPSMASVATPEQAADPVYMAALPELLKQRYRNTYTDDRTGLIEAAGRQDPVAFRAAAANLMGRLFSIEDQKVENIEMPGDKPEKATADVVTTSVLDGQAPQTVTAHKAFVFQDSTWLDCTDPAA